MLYFFYMLTRHTQGSLVWIYLVYPTPPEVRLLMHEFDVDPVIAQELLTPSFRQIVEQRGDMIYLTLHFSALRGIGHRPEQEIDFIIGRQFLITARYELSDPLQSFAKVFEVDAVLRKSKGHTNGGHLFIEMVSNLYRALIEESTLLEGRLTDIEDRIFDGAERRMVAEISQTGRIIHDFRQSFVPHREMLTTLEPIATRMFGPQFSYYIRELEGVYTRVEHTLHNLKETLMELRETNNSLLSTKQNEIMKTLTVLTFVFLPLLFLSEIFTMYESIPVGTEHTFWVVVGGMAAIAAISLLYFKRKGWL